MVPGAEAVCEKTTYKVNVEREMSRWPKIRLPISQKRLIKLLIAALQLWTSSAMAVALQLRKFSAMAAALQLRTSSAMAAGHLAVAPTLVLFPVDA